MLALLATNIYLNQSVPKVFDTYPVCYFHSEEIISTIMLYNKLLLSYQVVIFALTILFWGSLV